MMLGLNLREEFQQAQIKGTAVDFDPQAKSGALKVSAADFLKITYPSHDLLKLIEAIQPQTPQRSPRPVVVLGDRGRGKSHLLAAVYHCCNDPQAGKAWLEDWASQLKDERIRELSLCTERHIIGESLHHNRYRYLWDLIFSQHPAGQRILGKWQAIAEKTPGEKSQAGIPSGVPSIDLMRELFAANPTVLILDEFQTWYDGLAETKAHPQKKWAFNFIQNLSEIAEKEPELLTLIVSIRDSQSEAYQQIHRVNPVRVDFKGDYAKADRRRLLLHRLFENRRFIAEADIQQAFKVHVDEYFRLAQIPESDRDGVRKWFLETYPYSPFLLNLLDDQVLVATDAQETRDLIRILVDLFKNANVNVKQQSAAITAVITAADLSLTNEKSGVASLLDSVANPTHRKLRELAIHNLTAIKDASKQWETELPHCEEIISSLWLRSLTTDNTPGAHAEDLQLDITRSQPIDDNTFLGELTTIRENSFNIHEVAGRLLFKNEENPLTKLSAHAKNDKRFEAEQDIDFLAQQIGYVLRNSVSQSHRLIVMKSGWETNPWERHEKDNGKDKNDHPDSWGTWDTLLTTIIIPEFSDTFGKTMGTWLKNHMPHHRNAVRFLFPSSEYNRFYSNTDLMLQARKVYLAGKWSSDNYAQSSIYTPIKTKHEKVLRETIKGMFDRYAVLNVWDFQEPVKCTFHIEGHQSRGEKILEAVDRHICDNLFVPEDFEEYVRELAQNGDSVSKLISELKEPRTGGKPCIPWIGETKVKEKLVDLAAEGKIAINIRGTLYQANPGEERDAARSRMQGKIEKGKSLNETTIHLPDPNAASSGSVPVTSVPVTVSPPVASAVSAAVPPAIPQTTISPSSSSTPPPTSSSTPPTTSAPTSLIESIAQKGFAPTTVLTDVTLRTEQITAAQLLELLKNLPQGVTFTLKLNDTIDE